MAWFESILIAVQHTTLYDLALIYFAAYPIVTSIMWVTTSMFFVLRWERDNAKADAIDTSFAPKVTVLVPAHNEEALIADTLEAACRIDYPDYEVVVVNDGSTDATRERIAPYVRSGLVRLVDKLKNEGKALALNDALPLVNGDIVLIMDADAAPEPDILWRMVPHFASARVAAVTGNPRVRNVETFLARLQAVEFTSIISLLRRSQRIWGRIVTVSGVVAAFRKHALFSVQGFSPDMPTEDIELTWKLQRECFDIRYEPRAIVWMTVPSTLGTLFKQRLRWARGLMQVLHKHRGVAVRWRLRRMWPMFAESSLSVLWAICFVVLTSLWIVSYAMGIPPVGASPIPNLWGMTIGTLCLLQLGVGVLVDHRYDRGVYRYFPYAVYYPIIYWAFLAVTTFISLRHLVAPPSKKAVTWSTRRSGAGA